MNFYNLYCKYSIHSSCKSFTCISLLLVWFTSISSCLAFTTIGTKNYVRLQPKQQSINLNSNYNRKGYLSQDMDIHTHQRVLLFATTSSISSDRTEESLDSDWDSEGKVSKGIGGAKTMQQKKKLSNHNPDMLQYKERHLLSHQDDPQEENGVVEKRTKRPFKNTDQSVKTGKMNFSKLGGNNNIYNKNSNYRNKENNKKSSQYFKNNNRPTSQRRKSDVINIYTKAQQALRKGKLDEAENLFRKCLMIDRKDPHSWLGLARLATRTGKLEEANNYFSQGVSECPTSVHLLQAWALLKSRCNDTEKARNLFAKGLELEPGNPYIIHAWGDMERKLNNPEKARELYSTSLKLRGPWAQLYIAASELEIEDGRIEEAKRILEEGIGRCIKDSNKVLIALAKLEEQLIGDTDRAVILLSEAIHTGIDRDDVEPSIALAQLEIRRGNYRAAIDIMKRARNLKGVDTSLFNVWASLEAKSGRMEQSISILQEALSLFPDDSSVLQSLGTLQYKMGNYDKAREHFAKSISKNPTVAAYNAWAILEERSSSEVKNNAAVRDVSLTKARNLFVSGLSVDPTHGPLYNAYGSMEEKIGNITGARDVYKCGVKAKCTDAASVWHGWASLEIRQGNFDLAKKLLRNGLNMEEGQSNLEEIDGLIESYKKSQQESWLEDRFTWEEENNDYNPPFPNSDTHYPSNIYDHDITTSIHSSTGGALNDLDQTVTPEPLLLHRKPEQKPPTTIISEEAEIESITSKTKSIPHYTKKSKSRGNLAFLYHTLGMLEMNHVTKSNLETNPYRSNLEEAKLVFDEALTLYPRSSQIAVGAALVYERLEMIDEARALFRKGVKLDKNHEQAWQAWAVMERKQGNIQKARTLFESGIAANPNHGALWQAYGVLEVHEKEVERARSLFKEGIKRDSCHVMLYQALACLEVRLENGERSRELIKEGLRHEPTHGACWSVYGIIEEKFGTAEEARNIFEAGIANSKPMHAPLFRVFADFERRCQNFSKARKLYEKAIDIDPFYSTAYAMYASMEMKIGNMANFRRIVNRAQRLIGDKFDWNPNNPFSLPTNRYFRERDFNEF